MEAKTASKGKSSARRWVVRVAVVVVAVALAVVLLLPRPEPVAAVPLAKGTMRVELDGEGRTRLRDQFTVSAPVTGELERITLRVGDVVAKGAVIARLSAPARDPAQLEELRRRADAADHVRELTLEAERQASITLAALRRERDRLVTLVESGAVPRRDIEQANVRVALAERDLAAAQHRAESSADEVAAIRASVVTAGSSSTQSVVVRAPAPGTIMRIVEPSRRTVLAGSPLVVLGDPKRLEVVIDLLSTDAVRVTPGDVVKLDGWGEDRVLEARVRHVEPVGVTKISALGIEEQRVDVIADLANASPGLGDGYRVDAHIVVWEMPNVVKAPTSALFRSGEQWCLFVVRDGRVVKAPVAIGQRTPFEAEILDGVAPNELVIPFPSDRIEAGMRVEVVSEE